MMESSHDYSKEDWLVHAHYGIGQVRGIEVKGISGDDVEYYRIKTNDCTFWMPVEKIDSQLVRPVSSIEEIRGVIAILQRPPKEMSPDHYVRKNRIRSVQRQNEHEELARLVRDLQARQRDQGKYNLDEYKVIQTLKQRLVEEWSVVTGKDEKQIASSIDELINHQQLSEEVI